jgi:hypothetical protein
MSPVIAFAIEVFNIQVEEITDDRPSRDNRQRFGTLSKDPEGCKEDANYES